MAAKEFSLVAGAVGFALLACVAGRVLRFSYVGCFVDWTSSVRDINGLNGVSQINGLSVSSDCVSGGSMSRELCSSVCSLGGFPYFGLQSAQQCFCGKSFGSQGAASESDCSMACLGNSSQICGGSRRNSVFALTYPNKNLFTRSELPGQTVITSQTALWTITAKYDAECLIQCEANPDCQAAVLSGQQPLCHLLRFAHTPAGLNITDGDFFVRG